MAKSCNDSGLDAALTDWTDASVMVLTSAQPTSYAELTSTYALADVTPTFDAIANGDSSGRKRGIQAKSGVAVDTSGTATHCGLGKATGSILKYVTTTTPQAVVAGGTVDIGAWKIEVADPT